MTTAPDAFHALYGMTQSQESYAPGGHGGSHSDKTDLRGLTSNYPLSGLFGDDAGLHTEIGHAVVIKSNHTVQPEVQTACANLVSIDGELPSRFDFRCELINLLFSNANAKYILAQMILVLEALAMGTMAMNDKYVACIKTNNSAAGGRVQWVGYGQNAYMALSNRLRLIYSNVVSGDINYTFPTITAMRGSGQTWNERGAHGIFWHFSGNRHLMLNNLCLIRDKFKDSIGDMFFNNCKEAYFRRALALHIATFCSYVCNAHNATITYNVPSACADTSSNYSCVSHYISASVLAMMSERVKKDNRAV